MTFETEAVVMRAPGNPDVLQLRKISLPWPAGGNDVLVALAAAGVNPADTFFRQLGPYIGDGCDCVLGHDGAGIVQAVGQNVTTVRPGDRVCFCNGGVGGVAGTYARHTIVPETLLAKVPDTVSLEQAAAFPLVFITGWEAIVERAQISKGDKVLVHGGAGGTGHVAIQIAKALGAQVATTVSSDKKAAFARAMGADKVINYREQDFVAAVLNWSPDGVEMVLDNAGAAVFQNSLHVLAPYGHMITLMGTPGDVDDTAYNANLSIHNVMMLTPMWKGLIRHQKRQAAIIRQGLDWLGDGRLKVHIGATLPLSETAKAHQMLEQGGLMGKVILVI